MALSEAQIQRYARQLLLRGFSGRAQERLLTSPVTLIGSSLVLDIAATYLAAGGTPVLGAGGRSGFLAGQPLSELNVDAQSSLAPVLALVPTPLDPHGLLPTIWVGRARVEVLPPGASRPRHNPVPEAPPVLMGAAAAHLAQRWLLGEQAPAFADWHDGQFRWG